MNTQGVAVIVGVEEGDKIIIDGHRNSDYPEPTTKYLGLALPTTPQARIAQISLEQGDKVIEVTLTRRQIQNLHAALAIYI